MIASEAAYVRRDPTMPVRPVLTHDDAVGIGRRILALSRGSVQIVRLEHVATGITRLVRAGRSSSTEREVVRLGIISAQGGKASVTLHTNQLDEATLRVVVPYLEHIAQARLGRPTDLWEGMFDKGARTHLPVELWHEATVEALAEARTAKLPAVLEAICTTGLLGTVFVGAAARALCFVHADGLIAYGQETDAELVVTCWTPDGKGSGWGGAVSRNWATLDPLEATHTAIEIAQRSTHISTVEPGRYTAILGRAAVAQLVARMADAFDARLMTPFTLPDGKSRVGQRVFDARLTLRSDPADPEGGYFPFVHDDQWDRCGLPVVPMTWVDAGVLTHLAYRPDYAAKRGVTLVAEPPYSLRVEASGKLASVEEMIASCERGIYVNRFANIDAYDRTTGLQSGVTSHGCFLVTNGKITRAVKNFRFAESPFFAFNQLQMVGTSMRTAMGYTPNNGEWPLPPIIVPPMMVRDFNFSSLVDAV